MSYTFTPGERYRMPTHFGAATGPRRGPDGRRFDCRDTPRATSVAVSFLTDADPLETWLPPGFERVGEPVVTVTATYMTEIEWLAGRGYNMLGISFPAAYDGRDGRTEGSFLAVLWENLAEPIITGREELGYSKIFCDLPEPVCADGLTHCRAQWMGFTFMEMAVGPVADASTPELADANARPASPRLHYKYIPRTGEPGQADAAYAVLTPGSTPHRRVLSLSLGAGVVNFHRARWEEMPTQYMIVNALADLPVHHWRGASITRTVGGKDLSDMRILR